MHKSKTLRVLGLAVLVCGLGSAIFAANPSPAPSLSQSPKAYPGIAKAFVDKIISYERPGRILALHVKVGDEVKNGQLLAELNAEEEKRALEIDQSKATSEVSINAERAVRTQKQGELDRMTEVKTSVSPSEYRQAQIDVVVADARIELAIQQHKEDKLKVKQDEAALDKMRITSRMDGMVAHLFLQEGESAESGKLEAIRIMQVDPLLVEVPVPVSRALKLKVDDPATVKFVEAENDVRQGKITLIEPLADIGSQLIVVRVQIPNPQKTPANLQVVVDFSSPERVAQK